MNDYQVLKYLEERQSEMQAAAKNSKLVAQAKMNHGVSKSKPSIFKKLLVMLVKNL